MPAEDRVRFAGFPTAFVFDAPEGKKIQHLLWGDFLRLRDGEQGDWVEVRARGCDGWMRKADLQEERLLEINFVDIGQGDGCFIVTPQDRFLVIDAGESDNMYRFLRWRFNLRKKPDEVIDCDAAIITHPDADHYKGFQQLFDSPQFRFDTVYHNGLVERVGDDVLGAKDKHDGTTYLTGLVPDRAALDEIIGDPALVGRKLYPRLLRTAATSGRVGGEIRMLAAPDRFLPGYEDLDGLSIAVLGPLPEEIDGKPALRWFGDAGKTKNGHSVVLKLRYHDVTVLLGGDLNIPAENHLLAHYTGLDPENGDPEAVVARARETFQVDVAKACHHGSADFTSVYLRAVNPIATVISSGDGEPHCHPRPDALGTFGKHGRGDRPLIFSTELARSSRETIKEPNRVRAEIRDLMEKRDLEEDDQKRADLQKKIHEKLEVLERSVAVYGMINLRTDGHKVLMAQKLEEPRSGTGEKWDVHRLEPDQGSGELRYVSKHEARGH
jgi:beta-lactamase superfamily II metal-dependent hydrolase